MLTSIAGDDLNFEEGREYDVPAKIGRLLCTAEGDGTPRAMPVAEKPAERRETRQPA